MQWFLDPICNQARTAIGVQLQDEGGDKYEGLQLEQTPATERVKSEGSDVVADHLEEDGLLHNHCWRGGSTRG